MHHPSIGTIGKICFSLGLASLSPTAMPWLLPAVLGATTIATIATPAAVQASVLSTWEYNPSTQELEITVPGGTTPRYFLAAEPARIVLELPGTDLGTVTTEKSYGGAVRQIRVAQFAPGVTRIVLELAPGTVLAPGHAELHQVNGAGSSDRWVLRPLLASGATIASASTSSTSPTPAPLIPTPQATPSPTASGSSNSVFNGLPPLEPGATEIPVQFPPAVPDTATPQAPQSSSTSVATSSVTSPQPSPQPGSWADLAENPFQPRTDTFTIPVPASEQTESTTQAESTAAEQDRSADSSGSSDPTASITPESDAESPVEEETAETEQDESVAEVEQVTEQSQMQDEVAQETTQREAAATAQVPASSFREPSSAELPSESSSSESPSPESLTASSPETPQPMLPPAEELPIAPSSSAANPSLAFNIPPVPPAASAAPSRVQSAETVPAPTPSIAPAVPEPAAIPSSSTPSAAVTAADLPTPSTLSAESTVANTGTSDTETSDAGTSGAPAANSTEATAVPDPTSSESVPFDRAAPAEINPPTAIEPPSPSPVHPSTVTTPPVDAAPPTPVMNRSIEFGQPIPQSAFGNIPPIAAAVLPASSAPVTNSVRIPSGTVLSLRYPGDETLTLNAGQSRQEVMVLNEAVKDASGTVVLPEGSYIIGRFESKDNGSQFITQAISLQGRNVMLHAQSDTLSSDRELSQNNLLQNSALGVAAGLVLGGITGIGLIPAIAAGAATSAATTYVTAPQATLIQPNQVVEVRLIEDLTAIH